MRRLALLVAITLAPILAPGALLATDASACTANQYRNVSGQCVSSPVRAPKPPTGATAQCRDATWSFSKHRSGTCSGHGGVARWL